MSKRRYNAPRVKIQTFGNPPALECFYLYNRKPLLIINTLDWERSRREMAALLREMADWLDQRKPGPA